MRNDWISTETRQLLAEKRENDYKWRAKRYNQDTMTMILFFILLLPILSLSLKSEEFEPVYMYREAGVFFTCKQCRTSQWQDSTSANWRGEYFCTACGTKMGDE